MAHGIRGNLLKLSPNLRGSVKSASLENGTNKEIVAQLEREPELNGVKSGRYAYSNDDEL